VLVKSELGREEFGRNGGVGYVARHLRGKGEGEKIGAQTTYELGFCLWTMTYSPLLRSDFQSSDCIPILCSLVTSAQREKVVRVAVASLVNLTKGNMGIEGEGEVGLEKQFIESMIGCGLLKTVKNMMERQWADPDIVADVTLLNKVLVENYKDFSTWDKYQAEVKSGRMEWGVTHTEKFWRENARNMEGDDFQTLKLLVSLLSSPDDETVSIAAYDMGEWARFYPNGRSLVKKLGGKDVVMGLIDSENPEVARNALQCVSKVMVTNWEFVH